jgi:hypothetical protein
MEEKVVMEEMEDLEELDQEVRFRFWNFTLREKPHYFSIILIIDTPKSIFFFFSTSIMTIINRII